MPTDSGIQGLVEFQKDVKWLGENIDKVRRSHVNEFVAIKDGGVIAHDKTMEGLIEKLRDLEEDPRDVLIEFVFDRRTRLFL